MDVVVEINSSAYDHEITEASIRQAIMNPIYNDVLEGIYAKND